MKAVGRERSASNGGGEGKKRREIKGKRLAEGRG